MVEYVAPRQKRIVRDFLMIVEQSPLCSGDREGLLFRSLPYGIPSDPGVTHEVTCPTKNTT